MSAINEKLVTLELRCDLAALRRNWPWFEGLRAQARGFGDADELSIASAALSTPAILPPVQVVQ